MSLPDTLRPCSSAHRLLMALSLLFWAMGIASAQRSSFNIFKGNDRVGSIQVMRLAEADRATYLITSYAEIDMVLKQVVRTSQATEYVHGHVVACNTMLRLNKGLRDSSNMSSHDGVSRCYVHPGAPFQRTAISQWTTARMYFEEPVGQTSVFVESVLQDCPLRKTGPNTYTLTFPNRNETRYIYLKGVLQEIQVDRLLVDLVFRRA
jgi:hypothetical protein